LEAPGASNRLFRILSALAFRTASGGFGNAAGPNSPPLVRRNAVYALAAAGDESVLPLLSLLAQADDPVDRRTAGTCLDLYRDVRQAAADAAGRLGMAEAKSTLTALAENSPYWYVRNAARDSLTRLAGGAPESWWWRHRARQKLGIHGHSGTRGGAPTIAARLTLIHSRIS